MEFDFDNEKILEWITGDIDWSGGDGEMLMYGFYGDHPEYDPEENDEPEEPPKKLVNEWVDGYFDSKIYDMAYTLNDLIDDGYIKIWREITAKKNWKPSDRNLGVYWSWDKRAADAHWSENKSGYVTWLIESVAHVDQVDWNATIALNLAPSLGEDEKEIRLKEGVEVPIVALWREGKPVAIDEYEGKKYRANPRGKR